uniref:Tetratricopeptide repeat protein 36 n=1 Tax=Acrobeloides nanus TaxID=290746 RepID=A0A914BZT9_9BILA
MSENYSDLPNIDECTRLEALGVRAAESKDYSSALEKFSEAIEKCPGNPSPYNNRAQTYRLMEKITEALADLDKAIEISKGRGKSACQAYTQRALVRRLQGKDDEAKEDYEKASNLGSSFAKMQLVTMNPYAAMCNKMLHDVIGKLQRGEPTCEDSKSE